MYYSLPFLNYNIMRKAVLICTIWKLIFITNRRCFFTLVGSIIEDTRSFVCGVLRESLLDLFWNWRRCRKVGALRDESVLVSGVGDLEGLSFWRCRRTHLELGFQNLVRVRFHFLVLGYHFLSRSCTSKDQWSNIYQLKHFITQIFYIKVIHINA